MGFSKHMIFALVYGFSTFFCGQRVEAQQSPLVMTSIRPLEMIVKEIASPVLEIKYLIPPLQSPHTFDPRPQDLIDLEKSDLFFYVSKNLDEWVVRNGLNQPKNKEVFQWVKTKLEINKDKQTHNHGHNHHFDPHFWMNPLSVEETLNGLTQTLCKTYQTHCKIFKKNAQSFSEKLKKLDTEVSSILEGYKNEAILSAHPFLGYFARRFELRQLASVQVVPGKISTAKDIITLTKLIKREKIKALFSEPQIAGRSLEVLSENTGLKIAVLDPQGADPEIQNYRDLILWNTNRIKEAFQK